MTGERPIHEIMSVADLRRIHARNVTDIADQKCLLANARRRRDGLAAELVAGSKAYIEKLEKNLDMLAAEITKAEEFATTGDTA